MSAMTLDSAIRAALTTEREAYLMLMREPHLRPVCPLGGPFGSAVVRVADPDPNWQEREDSAVLCLNCGAASTGSGLMDYSAVLHEARP